jgi:hypothetical protein
VVISIDDKSFYGRLGRMGDLLSLTRKNSTFLQQVKMLAGQFLFAWMFTNYLRQAFGFDRKWR